MNIIKLKQATFAIFIVWLLTTSFAYAEGLFLVRITDKPENVMLTLQDSLRSYGYTTSHVQKCDGGMHSMGYETDYYKVVFFGKPNEVRSLTKKYPSLIPYLPLKIAIFAEHDDTLLTAVNPVGLTDFFADKEVKTQLKRWKNDIKAILSDVRQHHALKEGGG